MRLVVLLFLSSLVVVSCATNPTLTIAPDSITSYIEGKGLKAMQDVWDELGIKTRLSEYWAPETELHVERLEFNLKNGSPPYVILNITNTAGDQERMNWECLVFEPVGTEWKFLGNVDVWGQQWRTSPNPRLVSIADHLYMIAYELAGTGSGALIYNDRWYEIGNNITERVLSYPVDGHISFMSRGFYLKFKGRGVDSQRQDNSDVVDTELDGDYTFWSDEIGKDILLFSEKGTARYVWDVASKSFVLDAAHSNLLPEQYGDGFDVFSNEELLHSHFESLKNMAANPSKEQRQWLGTFLKQIGATPEKETLEQLLQQ